MLRLVVNPYDEEAFKRVLKESNFGIGDTTIAKIGQAVAEAAVQDQRLSFYEVTGNPDAFIAVNSGTKGKLFRFRQTVDDCIAFAVSNNVYETVREVIRRFQYNEILAKESDTIEGKAKVENLQELVDSIQQAVIDHQEAGEGELNVTEYLSTISLDEPDPAKDDPHVI